MAISDLLSSADFQPRVEIQWHEEPVPLTTFVQDKDYLGQPPLSDIQYDAVLHAERIYFMETYAQLAQSSDRAIRDYWSTPVRMVNFLELEWGKGGGKDHICRMSSLRISYLLLCLPSPQDYFTMPPQDTIHMLNVASNSRQASRAFFRPMRELVSLKGNWFDRQGVEAVEASQGRRGRRPQPGELQALQDTIRFPKNLEAISGHSDADAQEGLNLILGIADEIDAFKRSEELARYHAATARGESSRSAEAIVDMLKSSARTRFPHTFKNIHISWPRYQGSMIQTLVADGEVDIKRHGASSRFYVSGPHPNWATNPARVPGKWVFQDDYEKDPARARAMYECLPSRAINPYFSNEVSVKDVFKEGPPPLVLRYQLGIAGRSWSPEYAFHPVFRPVVGAQYAMHADLAITGDRAGIAIAHVKDWVEGKAIGQDSEGSDVAIWEQRPIVKVDALFAYTADKRPEPPREIQIRWARMLCLELRRLGWNIRLFTCDGFQSADTLQILNTQHGIETHVVSTDRASAIKQDGISQGEALWETLRDLISEGRLELAGPLTPEPYEADAELTDYDLCRNELLALSRMPNNKIDHPPGGSKDIADALAGAVAGAVYLGGREDKGAPQAYLSSFSVPEPSPLPLPMGFVPPAQIHPHNVLDHDFQPQHIDGMGRPMFPGSYDFGEVDDHQD